jgi:hypothetical protein
MLRRASPAIQVVRALPATVVDPPAARRAGVDRNVRRPPRADPRRIGIGGRIDPDSDTDPDPDQNETSLLRSLIPAARSRRRPPACPGEAYAPGLQTPPFPAAVFFSPLRRQGRRRGEKKSLGVPPRSRERETPPGKPGASCHNACRAILRCRQRCTQESV